MHSRCGGVALFHSSAQNHTQLPCDLSRGNITRATIWALHQLVGIESAGKLVLGSILKVFSRIMSRDERMSSQ